ncbi:MAG: flagellar hook-length control protein FliK [Halioglobus sp.]
MISGVDALAPVAAAVEGRPGGLRDGAEGPAGLGFGEILGVEGAARAQAPAGDARVREAATGGNVRQADGKNLPAAAAGDVAGEASPAQATVPAAGQPPLAGPLQDVVPVVSGDPAPPLLPVATEAPENATSQGGMPQAPLAAATPVAPGQAAGQPLPAGAPLALPARPASGSAGAAPASAVTTALPIPGPQADGRTPTPAEITASAGQRAVPVAAGAAATGPASPADSPIAAGAQAVAAPDAVLPDDQVALPQPLAGAVRAALGDGEAATPRLAPDTSAAPVSARGAQPAAALIGSPDQAVLPPDTQLAQGDLTRLPRDLLEEFAAEQLPNRAPAQAAAQQAPPTAQPGSFAALLPLADTDAALAAKTGVLPPLLATPADPTFHTELAGRISLLMRDGLSEARLQMNPPELGRLDIKISTDGDQARVSFLVQGADTRDAIEQAMPRLRELLEQSGLQLSRFDVSDHSRSQQGDHRAPGGYAAGRSTLAESEPAAQEAALRVGVSSSQSLVDYYV